MLAKHTLLPPYFRQVAHRIYTIKRHRRVSVCVCVFSSHLFWTSSSLDIPAGVAQEEGHTGFLIHLPSAVRALIFLARRMQPFLSLVDREVEFCVLTILSFSTCWAFRIFIYLFIIFSEKNPVCRGSNSRPNVSEGYYSLTQGTHLSTDDVCRPRVRRAGTGPSCRQTTFARETF